MDINIKEVKSVIGGYEFRQGVFILDSQEWDETYWVVIGTGTAWVYSFIVNTSDEQEAVSQVIEFCQENNFDGLYYTMDEMEKALEHEEDYNNVFDYGEAIGYYFDGDTMCFVELLSLEKL